MKYIYTILIILLSLPIYSITIDEFCVLCEKGDTKKIEENLSGVDINEHNSRGMTPLICAITSNKPEPVKFLIDHGAYINLSDTSGATPLLNAIANYNYDIIKLLINAGADVNICDRFNSSPLYHCVVNSGDLVFFNDYIFKDNKKDKPTKKEEEDNNNKLEIIGLLIDKGADMNHLNDDGVSPILQSIIDNNLHIFDLFVKKGFDINSYIGTAENTPLNICIVNKNPLFIDYLLEKGADINKPDKEGFLPIYSAIISDNLKLVKDLIEKGVDINGPINSDNDTPIAEACKLNREYIVNYLLEAGADLNLEDNYGFTPVHDAVLYPTILQKLTELGVSNIIPIKTQRSIVKLDNKKTNKKIERWQKICKEASEQSHRLEVPKIANIIDINNLINIDNNLKLICSLSENTKPFNTYLKDKPKELLIVIGPEGGFTKQEEELLINNKFLPVTLGKRIMRVETAAIYVTSIINYICEG